jgi:undecaprenol kinase
MKRFVKSVGYAITGWKFFFAKEKNGQLQMFVAIVVILLGFILHISLSEWQAILLCIALVLTLEMMNSAFEKIIDLLHSEQHPQIKWAKDVAAGSVLFASVISVVIASIIFLPKVSQFIHK